MTSTTNGLLLGSGLITRLVTVRSEIAAMISQITFGERRTLKGRYTSVVQGAGRSNHIVLVTRPGVRSKSTFKVNHNFLTTKL